MVTPEAMTMDQTFRSVWPEDDIVLISALEHWSYCPRQCALIHVEQTHEEGASREHGARSVRGMTLWSDRLGLHGKADVVEFSDGSPPVPFPVEHKSGKGASGGHDTIQLCAQALCLEEMFGVAVPAGAVAYHGSHRRRAVAFDVALRERTLATIAAVRRGIADTSLPPAVNDARCPACSLFDACLPDLTARPARLRGFQGSLFRPDDDRP
jgi:CRISPR-associated exonuclease Cas4